jgi:hypothetical protein
VRGGRLRLRATSFFLVLCSAQPLFFWISYMKDVVTNFSRSSERVLLLAFELMIYAVGMI